MERLPNILYANFSRVFIVLLLSDSIVFEFNVDDSLSYEPRSIVNGARAGVRCQVRVRTLLSLMYVRTHVLPVHVCGLFPEFASAKALIGGYRIRVSKVSRSWRSGFWAIHLVYSYMYVT